MKRSTKKGFTIVELVIVIAVIAILTAVLIPTFTSVTKKAKESSALQSARNELQLYTAEKAQELTGKDTFYIHVDTSDNDGEGWWFKVENSELVSEPISKPIYVNADLSAGYVRAEFKVTFTAPTAIDNKYYTAEACTTNDEKGTAAFKLGATYWYKATVGEEEKTLNFTVDAAPEALDGEYFTDKNCTAKVAADALVVGTTYYYRTANIVRDFTEMSTVPTPDGDDKKLYNGTGNDKEEATVFELGKKYYYDFVTEGEGENAKTTYKTYEPKAAPEAVDEKYFEDKDCKVKAERVVINEKYYYGAAVEDQNAKVAIYAAK